MCARKTVLCPAIERVKFLRVAENDSFLLATFQWEDTHSERAAVHPLEECGVLLSIEDSVIDPLGLDPFGHTAFPASAVHVHRQTGKGRVGRERKVKSPL